MSRKPSLKQRIQYHTDNLMARGPQAMIGLLGVFSLIIILLSAFVVTIGGRIFFPEGVDNLSFIEAFWLSLVRTLDPGTMGADEGWGFRLIMLILPTLGGVFIISTLIGVLSNMIQNKIEDLRKGRSLVLEENHTIILGWSSQVFTILSELVEANLNQVNPSIAILAMKEKVEMEDEIRSRLRDTKNTRIICRSGSPIDPAALELVRPQHARSIIVIPPEDQDPDNFVIKTVLAITNNPHRRAEAYIIVTQIRDEKNLQVVQMLGKKDRVCALLARDIIARVTAQTSRQSGLSIVYTELFNFSGDEIYFKEEKALTGKRYRDALTSYATSSVIGLFKADATTVQLNPPMDSLIQPGDQLICISADDDTILYSASPDTPAIESIQSAPQPISVKKERLLLLGWNDYGATILRELDNYVGYGSQITIVADETFQEKVSTCTRLKNQTIEFHAGDTTNRKTMTM